MSNKKIKPSETLIKYLNKTLRLERMKRKKLELPTKAVRNNDEMKVRALDSHIFRSMANLTYFFEFINLHPELIESYGEDIEDLLGLKSGDHRNSKGEGFVRFVVALLAEGSLGYEDDRSFYFRRRMLKVMQYLINQKAKWIVANSKKDPRGYDDTRFQEMIFHDLQRAEVWTSFLDRLTGHEAKNPNRVIDFKI